MIWNDERIKTWAAAGGVTPFEPACVNPASLDLRLGNLIRQPHKIWTCRSEIDMRKDIESGVIEHLPKWGEPETFDVFWLMPRRFVLCSSFEFVRIPATAASILVLKSSQGRLGLNHSHSGWGDPGFGLHKPRMTREEPFTEDTGANWTFELQNISPWPVKLTAGQRIIQQVMFDMTDAPETDYRYTGHYVYQAGPTPAREDKS